MNDDVCNRKLYGPNAYFRDEWLKCSTSTATRKYTICIACKKTCHKDHDTKVPDDDDGSGKSYGRCECKYFYECEQFIIINGCF